MIIWNFFSFIFGAVVGSFLNVCIYRIPDNESIIKPLSR
jgi:leader peptidase (prepilin peptidase)/N-methyltransferase